MAKFKKPKTLKRFRVYKITPKAGVNAGWNEMYVVSESNKRAVKESAVRTGILEGDLNCKRFKPKLTTIIARFDMERPNTNSGYPA